jgi:2-keto-3-deoxy-L-rhamnonate aldolase RhmA
MVNNIEPTSMARALEKRGMAIGTWIFFRDPDICEIAAAAGFDFIVINMEHGLLDLESVVGLIRAADCKGVDVIVRIPDGSRTTIMKVLDAGAAGIFVPGVETGQEAKEIVMAARFAPEGTRSFSPTVRANGYGRLNTAEFRAWSNRNVSVWLTLESKKAIENVDSIMESGVDAVITGRYDLSISMGLNDSDHPEIEKIIDKVAVRARKNAVGLIASANVKVDTPERMLAAARSWKARGARYIIFGKDCDILVETYKTVVSTFRDAQL